MGRAAEIKKIVAGTAREACATVKGASAQDGGAGAGPGGHAASSRRTSSAPPRGGPQPRGGAPDAPADAPLTNAPVFLSPAVPLLSPAQSVSAGRKGPTWAARGRADLPLRARPGVSVCVCVCGHLSGCHPVREAGPLVLARPTRGSGCGHSLSPPLFHEFHLSLLARPGTLSPWHWCGAGPPRSQRGGGGAAPPPPALARGQAVLVTWGCRRTIDHCVVGSHRHPE